ncbi:ribonuclease domain-containing protein [Helcococcus kunzii]|uniref:ribonuclease domain-containing protein n=1 Tax=Helcococcus kunzii TaxID=40091 RepID=UPI001BB03541|nr:ribonuclease domain-containing protein [Helcococcus kunzii]QUY64572.1 ribonuclease [Helcococcus kunzii]QZO76985.1 ribonuclease [Helcococcus kunzii]
MKKSIKILLIMIISIFSIVSCTKSSNKLESYDTIVESSKNKNDSKSDEITSTKIDENGHYYSKDEVALYLHTFGKLPSNYLTKNEAKKLGWDAQKGNLWKVTDKGVIGGDRFGNREGNLSSNEKYFEADVNYNGGHRGAERLVYTTNGKVIYYSNDHYKNFEVLYE